MRVLLASLFALACAASIGCSSASKELPDDDARLLPDGVGIMISESDRTVGAVEVIDPSAHTRITNYGSDFDPDAHLRRLSDPKSGVSRFFLVQSTKQRVLEVDRQGHILTRLDVSEPKWSDPLDVALAPDGALWVTRHASTSLLVLEPDGKRRCAVDLAPLADADGRPDMSAIAIVDGFAYVALRRLQEGFGVTNDSTVVRIDTKTCGPAEAFVTLPARNPWEHFVVAGTTAAPQLWINCIAGPLSGVSGAALVRIDLATRKATAVLDDARAGGFVNSFELVDDHTAYAISASYKGDNPTTLLRFDPSTGALDPSFPRTTSTSLYRLWHVAQASGVVLVADRTDEHPGIRILSATDGAQLGFLPTKLPPVELLILRD